ncbi:MAG: hypothetical protein Q8N23_02405 [Archangium sp.]|nr:hypothetical protein [Archangium sp.]MDP3151492.1 hypothetical protein [Archangium sp.]MDP3575384.1 hypothetical protein [Archangium sp.]
MTQSLSTRLALGAALALLLAGCPPLNTTNDSGQPEVDAGCDGLIGCQCVAGACTTGECVAGTCVDCRRGEAACICRGNTTCNAGLRCTGNRCESCPAGELGCACGTGDACGTGLSCSNAVCVTDTCVAGSANCPCRTGMPECDGALYCDSTLCRACSNDIVGCPCDGNGQCAGMTTCNGPTQTCRAAVTCAQLVADGMCAANQACAQINGADAQCVPNTCNPDFRWNGVTCVACVSAGCTNEPSCNDLDGGLGASCTGLNRTCDQLSATCGACLPGFTANPGGQCIAVPRCGSATCTFTQYCDRSSGTPTCTNNPPCGVGQATNSANTCAACAPVPTCTGPGFSGRIWPFMTAADVCVCETLDNSFLIGGGSASATACDLDGDGWVREEAGDPSVTGDRALGANARCTIKTVDRVRLFDEYGVSIDVLSCVEGLVKASAALPDGGVPNGGVGVLSDGGLMRSADGGNPCSATVPLRLLETSRNDIPGNPSSSNKAPAYGGSSGRLLAANELNSLTKACTSLSGDYNDNKLDDIAEVQGTVAPTNVRPTPAADRARLESFAYFVELDSAAAEGNVLSIRERSRCDATFPFHYAPDAGSPVPDDGYLFANDKPYWRACARNRDPSYALNNPRPGYDFANYGCDTTSLSCPLVPPAHPTAIAPVDPSVTLFRDFGLCRTAGVLPADRLWRGMNHHSQFKCVNVVSGALPNPFDRQNIEFGQGNGQLTFETCVARPCVAPGDLGCSSPQGTTAEPQTRQPVLDCTARAGTALVGNVGFAAVNYRPYRFADTFYPGNTYSLGERSYRGGCINEDDAWDTFLCPYPEFVLQRALADAQFGRYSCYKYGSNFMWAGPLPDGGTNLAGRSTLRWGANANTSVLGPRPPPDGGL